VCAYRLDQRILLFVSNLHTSGLRFNVPPAHPIDAQADAAEVGRTVRLLLARSRVDGEMPTDVNARQKALLEGTGFRSWSQLERRAAHCLIVQEESAISIEPSRNETRHERGPTRGHAYLPDRERFVSADCTDEVLGKALRHALDSCA